MGNVNIFFRIFGAKKAEDQTKKLGSSINGLAKSALVAAGAAVSIGLVARAVGDMVVRAGRLQGVRSAFLDLGESLEGLRAATRDTVDDFTLMQITVKGAQLGVGDMATKLEFATLRARQTGEEIGFLVEQLVLGLGRKSIMRLDDLGLSMVAIRDRMKETGDFAQAVNDIIEQELAKAGDESIAPLADKVEGLGTQFSNLYDEIAKVVGIAAQEAETGFFSDMLTGLADYVSFWHGDGSRVIPELIVQLSDEEKAANAAKEAQEELAKAYIDFVNKITEAEDKKAQELAFMQEYITSLIGVQTQVLAVADTYDMMKIASDRTVKSAEKLNYEIAEFAPKVGDLTHNVQMLGNQLVGTFDYIFTESLIRGQNFFDAFLAGFVGMLQSMVAETLARAAVFGIFSLFGGGGILAGAGSALSFISGGLKTSSSNVNVAPVPVSPGSGPISVNFNAPITDRNYVRNYVIPEIEKAVRLN